MISSVMVFFGAVISLLVSSVVAQFSTNGGQIYHGRASNYGPTDQFESSWTTGSCKCWGQSNYRMDTPCFDTINTPAHIAAVNTNGKVRSVVANRGADAELNA